MAKGIKRTFSMSEAYAPSSKRVKAANKIKKFMKRTTGNKYRQATAGVPELKYDDNTLNVSLTQTGSSQLVLTVAQGSDNTDRIGRKITIKSIQYDVVVSAATTELATYPNASNVAKMLVVYDKQPNGALGAWSDVINSTNSIVTPFCFKNYDNIDRFDILAIEEFEISEGGPNNCRRSRFIPLSLETRFDGTGATISDIQTGSIFVAYADQNGLGANFTEMQGRFRVLYSDD